MNYKEEATISKMEENPIILAVLIVISLLLFSLVMVGNFPINAVDEITKDYEIRQLTDQVLNLSIENENLKTTLKYEREMYRLSLYYEGLK